MSYRRLLLTRYSRRDQLSIVVIGVTVAFLTGSGLLFVSGTAQTQAIAADFDTPGHVTAYDSAEAARAGQDDAVVFSTAQVRIDGSPTTVLGVPPGANGTIAEATPSRGLASATAEGTETARVNGSTLTTTVRTTDRPSVSILPAEWYLGNRSFVDRLGTDGALVINASESPPDGQTVPLRAAALFFINGSSQALSLFGLLAGGIGVLVTIIVFSVTRMSTQDRYQTIKIVRATGGTSGRVRRLFTARAMVLTLAGVALGYAGGLIATRTAVNIGVFLGVPVSLDVSLSSATIGLLLPLYVGLLFLGALAGYIAAWPVSRQPPAQVRPQVDAQSSDLSRSWLSLDLLSWRSVVPTVATVAVFLTFLLLLISLVAVVGPLVETETATVVEPNSVHPVASTLPEAYASVLQQRGIEASPEILLFPVVDDQPILTRGGEFESFAAVSNATLTAGREPSAPDDAVIGESAARRNGIEVGDRLTLGGSTRSAITSVRVVGIFKAPGLYDDHLLISLPTARHLSKKGPGSVHVIRAERLPDTGANAISITSVSAPSRSISNGTIALSVTAVNLGGSNATRSIDTQLAGNTRSVSFTLQPTARQTRTIRVPAPSPGTWTLRVGPIERAIQTVPPETLIVSAPDRVPPSSEPRVRVETASGTAVENATVSVTNRTVRTGANGWARIHVPAEGTYDLIVTANGRTVSERISVDLDARRPTASLVVDPESPSFQVRPRVTLRLENPWHRAITVNATITGPQSRIQQSVLLDPGEQTSVSARLDRNPPGKYALTATAEDGAVLAERSLRVSGSQRLVAALATRGKRASTPFSQAVSTVFGNLQLLLGAVLGLGAVMTVGGLTATFAHGVHSRRRTIGIYRVTGASSWRILRLVWRDAMVIGTVATALAFVLSYGVLAVLSAAGALTAFGVAMEPVITPQAVVLGFASVLALVILGTGLATIPLLRASPAASLSDDIARGEP